jgi:hypothetical protein
VAITAAACLVALAASSTAGSLADAARREQERRDRLKANGVPAALITDAELAASKGDTANIMSGPALTGPAAREAPDTPPAARPRPASPRNRRGLAEPLPDGEKGTEEYWRNRAAEARALVQEAEAEYAALDRQIRLGQTGQRDANGIVRRYSIHQMKARADAAQAAVTEARRDLEQVLEAGRRAGALPGWLR